jgi:hypothetical protein
MEVGKHEPAAAREQEKDRIAEDGRKPAQEHFGGVGDEPADNF